LIKYNLKIKFYIKKSTASGLDKVVVNVTAVDANGQTVLHYAVAGDPDEPDDVVELLKRGAKVDARDRWAQTPLILAAFKNATRSAQVLIDQGANVNAENEDGWTALDPTAATISNTSSTHKTHSNNSCD
jgi:ankyrin repeat protein